MDKRIEKLLAQRLKGRNHLPFHELQKSIAMELNCEPAHVRRIFDLMKDRNEVEYYNGNESYVRLTFKGVEASRSLVQRTISYLEINWIAIIGAITGVAGTVLSIIALNK